MRLTCGQIVAEYLIQAKDPYIIGIAGHGCLGLIDALDCGRPALLEILVNRQYPYSGSPAVGWWDVPIPT